MGGATDNPKAMTEVSRRMNRWREHLGDDRLNGFGGRGPAEYAFMAENEPEGPGLSRFGEDCGEAS